MSDAPAFQKLIDDAVNRLVDEGFDRSELDPDRVAHAVTEEIRDSGDRMAEELRRREPAMLRNQRKIRAGFEDRLHKLWGPGLDALEAVCVASYEAGEETNKASERDDPQIEALARLHARACLVASEILSLLRGGFASGALARWRTLHELAVVALLIHKGDRTTAERYLVHADVGRAGRLDAYQRYAERLGETRLTPQEEKAVLDRRTEVLRSVGDADDFRTQWGWAGPDVGKRRPNFTDLLTHVDLDHWRPWVDVANLTVHAGSGGLMDDIGNDGPFLLAGPSNAGLGIVGHNSAISLHQATVAFLIHHPTAERSVVLLAIKKLVDDVGESFAACEAEYGRRKAELDKDHTATTDGPSSDGPL